MKADLYFHLCAHRKTNILKRSLCPVSGTMSDDEMRKLGVQQLQDDGYIFLWVTGR